MSICNRFRAISRTFRQTQRLGMRSNLVATTALGTFRASQTQVLGSPAFSNQSPYFGVKSIRTFATEAASAKADGNVTESGEDEEGSTAGTKKKNVESEDEEPSAAEAASSGDEKMEFAEESPKEKELTKQVSDLQKGMKKMEDENMKLKQLIVNARDDLDRTVKRTNKEKEDMKVFAVQKFAKEMLTISDNLELALKNVSQETKENCENPELKGLIEGLDLTYKTLQNVFGSFEIVKIPTTDMKADFNLHEVMFVAPIPGKEDMEIIQVMREGYTIGERCLRSSQVGVVKNS